DLPEGHGHTLPMVIDLDHVPSELGDRRQDTGEAPGLVGYVNRELGEAPRRLETVAHDLSQDHEVDVAAGEHDADRVGCVFGDQPLEQRGYTHGAGRLDHQLRPLQDQREGGHGLGVVDCDHAVDV